MKNQTKHHDDILIVLPNQNENANNEKQDESRFICDDDIKSSPYVLSSSNEHESSSQPYFEDLDFPPTASSIQGSTASKPPRKCRCQHIAQVSFQTNRNTSIQKPYYHCPRRKCNYFAYAYTSEQIPWFRFGSQDQFTFVKHNFHAEDLVQGRIGDCWFLSALSVIAQRTDLIARLFPKSPLQKNGKVEVRLFMDGWWRSVIMDNFLPCFINSAERERLNTKPFVNGNDLQTSVISLNNIKAIHETYELLAHKYGQMYGQVHPQYSQSYNQIKHSMSQIKPSTEILAYSKSKKNQLWVPFLEKAYAKSHGSYSSISGGYIAEAFLDLTGCPTLSFDLHSRNLDYKHFWNQLKLYRKQTLPMGCGTAGGRDLQEVGLMGHHAYSILDIREFHISRLTKHTSEIGNVSGFGNDGIVRLLKIRNPHGQGEWKGDWSDQSIQWQTLLKSNGLYRKQNDLCSMKNDGMFWMDYDHFLMGFHNVDVCLAFPNMHAKSFATSFPPKQSPIRCDKAFHVSVADYAEIDADDDIQEYNPHIHAHTEKSTIEIYVMAIQKTKRGISSGQTNKKKSYQLCDLGFLILYPNGQVDGTLLGMKKNGHFRFVLSKQSFSSRFARSATVIPINFGHPAATDKELSLTIRFVASGPLKVQPLEQIPAIQTPIQKFCFQTLQTQIIFKDSSRFGIYSCTKMNGGGTVFVYLLVADEYSQETDLNFKIEARVRGMSCRTNNGLEQHEVISKSNKKFEAAWRKFTLSFQTEKSSRLLCVLVQSGQTWEVGNISAQLHSMGESTSTTKRPNSKQKSMDSFYKPLVSTITKSKSAALTASTQNNPTEGVFSRVYPNQVNESTLLLDNSASYSTASKQNHSDFDLFTLIDGEEDIKAAIEASRKEYESLEQCRVAKVIDESLEMKEAIQISEETSFKETDKKVQTSNNSEEEKQLQKAIEMSLSTSGKIPNEEQLQSKPVVVDMTNDFIGMKQFHDSSLDHVIDLERKDGVIDLLSSDEEEEVEHILSAHRKMETSSKRQKIGNDKSDCGNITPTHSENQTKLSVEQKRRLALEAAQKRLQSIQS